MEAKDEKKYWEPVKPSMRRRCNDHDYTERSLYMITMTIEDRRPLLGRVEGDCDAAPGSNAFPHFVPSALGEAVSRNWYAIREHHPEVEVIALQLMPDHLHGILFVTKKMDKPLGKVILGFVQGCNKSYRQLMGNNEMRQSSPAKGLLFAHGFNDRILTHKNQLDAWKQYLAQNPYRLAVRRSKMNYFRVMLATAGDLVFTAQGNRALLDAKVIKAVKCSRKMSEEDIKEAVAQALAAASNGAVHISPFISNGEKKVRDALLKAGYPIIVLVENGLTRYSKPAGEMFNTCALGKLLVLSPWEYHTSKSLLNRDKCTMLNEMAAQVAHLSAL